MSADRDGLDEQIGYYRARAAEYDEWWMRQGRYDHGPALNAQWFRDVHELEAALADFAPRGSILELAGGTGIWSERLLDFATELTVVDASPEALAINRRRLASPRVRFIEADLFDWEPESRFDIVFFSFWLSHVPDSEFDAFWRLVGKCLAPGGRVFFVDSRREKTSTALDQHLSRTTATMERRLNDGRTFRIYKVYYETTELRRRLARLGWRVEIATTSQYFLYGCGVFGSTTLDRRQP